MKMNWNKISNLFLLLVLGFFLSRRLPGVIDQFRSQGAPAAPFHVSLTDSTPLTLGDFAKPLVVVFWATWCGPCEVELARINRLIANKDIDPKSVLAVSSFEEAELVAKTARDRGYLFTTALDPEGTMARDYKVAGTPTIVLINSEKKIEWMTTGLSPSLELRLKHFLQTGTN